MNPVFTVGLIQMGAAIGLSLMVKDDDKFLSGVFIAGVFAIAGGAFMALVKA